MTGDSVCAIGEIAAEDLVGAFAAECDGTACLTKLGEKPHWQCSRICARLIGIVGELPNGTFKVLLGIQIELFVLGTVMFDNFGDGRRLIEAVTVERNRKCPQP